MRAKEIGEFGLIARLCGKGVVRSPSVVAGTGDDCAIVRPDGDRDLVLTCDCQIQGVHFRNEWISAMQLGRRVAAVNLSDVAAMGAQPRWALCSLAIPGGTEVEWVEELYAGLREGLDREGAPLVGGNTARLDAGVMIDLFLVGDVPRGRGLRRGGAKPGDLVFVTGELGGAAAGLELLKGGIGAVEPVLAAAAIARHLVPSPRLREGRALGDLGRVTACIDVSDGLEADARHVAEESGVVVRLDADRIPISGAAAAICAGAGGDPVELALRGGEDFELLFTAERGAEDSVCAALEAAGGVSAHRIGEIAAGASGVVVERSGRAIPAGRGGFDHFPPA